MNPPRTLFVDLDQTVYPESSGIWDAVAERINMFLERELGLTPQEAGDRRVYFYKKYGTTLRGLQTEGDVDPIEYMNFIHDVPIEEQIPENPKLYDLLQSIKRPKFIFTNASIDHAERVLNHLGIAACFDDIIDIIRLDYVNKPNPLAYQRALDIAGNPAPESSVLIDDSLGNLKTAADLGMTTVHIGANLDPGFVPDHQIASILNLAEILPDLQDADWRGHSGDG